MKANGKTNLFCNGNFSSITDKRFTAALSFCYTCRRFCGKKNWKLAEINETRCLWVPFSAKFKNEVNLSEKVNFDPDSGKWIVKCPELGSKIIFLQNCSYFWIQCQKSPLDKRFRYFWQFSIFRLFPPPSDTLPMQHNPGLGKPAFTGSQLS